MLGSPWYYNNPILNYIFKLNFSSPRHQIFIFPAVVLYVKNIIKSRIWQERLLFFYVIAYVVYILTGMLLFFLGF